MKKVFYTFIFLIFFFSCKSVDSSYSDLSVNYTDEDMLITDSLTNDAAYINTIVDGHKLTLKFDTGATTTVINNLDYIGGEAILPQVEDKVNVRNAINQNFKAIPYKAKTFETNILNIKDYNCLVYNVDTSRVKLDCVDNLMNQQQGVLGLDVFLGSDELLSLNFEKGTLSFIERNEDFKQENYQKVTSSFKYGRIKLLLRIGKKWNYYLFDTGANFFINSKENPFKEEQLPESSFKDVKVLAGNSVMPSNSLYYKDQSIMSGGLDIKKNIVQINEGLNSNILGYNFIRNYNWIIDFKRNKVYAQKIRDFDSDVFFDKLKDVKYLAAAVNNQLMIIYSTDDKYVVGGAISSVKGEEITDENICEMQRLLIDNKSDWSDLQVEL